MIDVATEPEAPKPSIVTALSQLAVDVQRRRTVDDVLETTGRGVLHLGMRLGVFQLVGKELVLRYYGTSAQRLNAIEERVGRRMRGLSAPIGDWDLVVSVVKGRRILFRTNLDLFDRFLLTAVGYDTTPLDAAPETAGVTTGVLAPLYVRDEPWGLLAIYSPELTRLDADAVALFTTHVGSALEVAESLDALARAQQELVKGERLAALGELAAVVAHEVRNPLGVLFNSIALLKTIIDAGAMPDRLSDASDILRIAAEEAERLKAIVSDLLQYARPHDAEPCPYSVAKLVDEIAGIAHDPRVRVSVEPDLPPVIIDPRHMRQALLNLTLNGLQALTSENGRVTVGAAMASYRGRPCVHLYVADTGMGIPENVRGSIFRPFFTTKAAGTGLGLPIVKRIADAHHAEIDFESSEAGTTFNLWVTIEQN